MNRSILPMKIFGVFLVFFLCLNLIKADPPPVGHNWTNSMGWITVHNEGDPIPTGPAYFCVNLLPDYQLNINLYVYLAVESVSSYPEMKFSYTFKVNGTQVLSGLTAPVSNTEEILGDDGELLYYRAKFPLTFNGQQYCGTTRIKQNEIDAFDFGLEYQLVMPYSPVPGSYSPYPMGQYPELWPSSGFSIPPSAPSISATKLICCATHSQPIVMNGDGGVMNTSGQQSLEIFQNDQYSVEAKGQTNYFHPLINSTKENIGVSPNPFTNELTVHFNIVESSTVVFKLIDLQGRVLKNSIQQYDDIGDYLINLETTSLPAGLYYLMMSVNNHAEMVKLVKERI